MLHSHRCSLLLFLKRFDHLDFDSCGLSAHLLWVAVDSVLAHLWVVLTCGPRDSCALTVVYRLGSSNMVKLVGGEPEPLGPSLIP